MIAILRIESIGDDMHIRAGRLVAAPQGETVAVTREAPVPAATGRKADLIGDEPVPPVILAGLRETCGALTPSPETAAAIYATHERGLVTEERAAAQVFLQGLCRASMPAWNAVVEEARLAFAASPLGVFLGDLPGLNAPAEGTALWLKHRAALAPLAPTTREAAWKALCQRVGDLGQANPSPWLKKAVAEALAQAAAIGAEAPSAPAAALLGDVHPVDGLSNDLRSCETCADVVEAYLRWWPALGKLESAAIDKARDNCLAAVETVGGKPERFWELVRAGLARKPDPTPPTAPKGTGRRRRDAEHGEHVAPQADAPAANDGPQSKLERAREALASCTATSAPMSVAQARTDRFAVSHEEWATSLLRWECGEDGCFGLFGSFKKHRRAFEVLGVLQERLALAAERLVRIEYTREADVAAMALLRAGYGKAA